ncbi:MAG: ABC-type Fe3+ transport system protein [Labilithrix sp.]|nr:ABC-type Fe3+ transport system protein [Labilithrix sp.]
MADPVVIEFDSPERITLAAAHLRSMGYSELEAYTPFPMPDLAEAIGTRRTKLPWLVLLGGATGLSLAYLVIWWTNAFDYRLDVGGRPYDSLPADIPIMFESTVLLAASTAFLSALVLSGLPRLHHPVFELDGFERTTIDRFWITLGAPTETGELLEGEIRFLREELAPFRPIAVRDARRERTSVLR